MRPNAATFQLHFFRASDSFSLPAAAQYVRSLGIKIFAVGVGKANVEELKVSFK